MKYRGFVILLLAVLLVSACGQDKETPTKETVADTATLESTLVAPEQELKIGFVTFLSGAAAAPFGVPSRNAVEVVVEQINQGLAPAPYDTPGIGGASIKVVYADEAGDAETQQATLRKLVLEDQVDLVIGYVSSGNCETLAPLADELQTMVVFYTCGTNSIFEENDFKYLFRTNAHQIIDNVAAARYVLDQKTDVASISGINQNYSWGQDSWGTFNSTLAALGAGVQVDEALFPDLLAGEFSAEIALLNTAKSDIVHSSFWGGDLEALIVQGGALDLFDSSMVLLTTGDTMLPRLGVEVPPGVIIGGRGLTGALAPDSDLNTWLVDIYKGRYNIRPSFSAYHAVQAVLGAKAACEKAIADNSIPPGALPTQEQVIDAFAYLEFETPSGTISMALGNGHQAVAATAYGITGEYSDEIGEVELVDVVRYPVWCVNPPEGITSAEWIAGGFEDADCP